MKFSCEEKDAETVEKTVTDVMITATQKVLDPLMINASVEVDSGIGTSWAAEKP